MPSITLEFKNFAIDEMRQRGNKIKAWAQQSDNELLRILASEVIEAAGQGVK